MTCKEKKVLIIDDNITIRELVAATLHDTEFELLEASSGRDGIEMAKKEAPDIILLDIMMPEVDGFMTCNLLKQSDVTKRIPVIFLSAMQTARGHMIAGRAGANDYITKPFSPGMLLEKLRMHSMD